MAEPAIQNLDFLRQLISEANDRPPADDVKLRMYQGFGVGTDAMPSQQGDR